MHSINFLLRWWAPFVYCDADAIHLFSVTLTRSICFLLCWWAPFVFYNANVFHLFSVMLMRFICFLWCWCVHLFSVKLTRSYCFSVMLMGFFVFPCFKWTGRFLLTKQINLICQFLWTLLKLAGVYRSYVWMLSVLTDVSRFFTMFVFFWI